MLVTIFSDASRCARTGASGWAAWAKSDRLAAAAFASHPFGSTTASAGEAELAAIARAVAMAISTGVAAAGDHLLLQADNLRALSLVDKTHGETVVTRAERAALAEITIALSRAGIDNVTVRHVKAHSGRGEPRLAVHSRCDVAAKAAMRRARVLLGHPHNGPGRGSPRRRKVSTEREGASE